MGSMLDHFSNTRRPSHPVGIARSVVLGSRRRKPGRTPEVAGQGLGQTLLSGPVGRGLQIHDQTLRQLQRTSATFPRVGQPLRHSTHPAPGLDQTARGGRRTRTCLPRRRRGSSRGNQPGTASDLERGQSRVGCIAMAGRRPAGSWTGLCRIPKIEWFAHPTSSSRFTKAVSSTAISVLNLGRSLSVVLKAWGQNYPP